VALINEPEKLLDCDMEIFKSEPLLYQKDGKLNHRLQDKYIPVRNALYESHENDKISAISISQCCKHSNAFQIEIVYERLSARGEVLQSRP